MERFDPCGTDECKKRCDSYGVACEDIMADEIERLRAELARARDQLDEAKTELMLTDTELLRSDANRYRWLRNSDSAFGVYVEQGLDDTGWIPTDGANLDRAIDAALAAEGEKP